MEFPELKDDEVFLNQIDLVFYSNQLFEEWKKLGNLEKRAGLLSTLLGIAKSDGQPYFHIDYLVDKILKLTPEEKEENNITKDGRPTLQAIWTNLTNDYVTTFYQSTQFVST
jgi:hypothetical protein